MLLLSVLRYGRLFSTALIGAIWSAVFIWVGWQADLLWSIFLLYLLAVLGVINTLHDRQQLTLQVRNDPSGSHDAAEMAKNKIMGCRLSAGCWASLWSIISFLLLGVAFWFTWLRNLSG